MKRLLSLIFTTILVISAYGQRFQAGFYEEDDPDGGPVYIHESISFYLNGTFSCKPLGNFPIVNSGQFKGWSLHDFLWWGKQDSDNITISGTYTASGGRITLRITGENGLSQRGFNMIYKTATFNYSDGVIYLGRNGIPFKLKERFETAAERSRREAQEAREAAEWERRMEAERRAEEAAKAKQWKAVLAAKKTGSESTFLLEADKYSKLSIDDESRYKLNMEIIDFHKSKQEYEKVMQCCEDLYSAKGFQEKNGTYETTAKQIWNELATTVIEKSQNSPEMLCLIAKNNLVNDANKSLALQYAQEYAYNNVVLTKKNFREVEEAVYMKYSDIRVFDNNYIIKIRQYSDSLRLDSVSHLLAKAKDELAQNWFSQVKNTCNSIENIDPSNKETKGLKCEADYGLLMQQKVRKVNDYTDFLNLYPASKYYEEVSDMCANEFFANKNAYKNNYSSICSYSYFLNGLQSKLRPSSKNADRLSKVAHSTQKKCSRHQFWDNAFDSMFKCDDCRFASINLGGSLGITGGTEFVGAGEVGLRIFHKCKWLNIYLGAKYLYTSGISDLWTATNLTGEFMEGYLTSQHIAIPAELRINFKHECEKTIYLGVGAEYGIPLNGSFTYLNPSNYNEKQSLKSKDYLNPASIWPRASIGYSSSFMDFSLVGTYMPDGLYNMDNLRMASADELVGQTLFDKQLKSKFKVELSIKYFY